jgi:HSP20 family molecular chaperone IbpA
MNMVRVQLRPVSQAQNSVIFRPISISAEPAVSFANVAPAFAQAFAAPFAPAAFAQQFQQPPFPVVQQFQQPQFSFAQAFQPAPFAVQPQVMAQPFQWPNQVAAQSFGSAPIGQAAFSAVPAFPAFFPIQQQSNIIQPNVDLAETSSEVVVACELPYVDQNHVNLSVNDNSVTIQALSQQGIMYRTVSLPTDIRPESCEATFTNGVLEIKMPKTTRGRRKVNVNEQ